MGIAAKTAPARLRRHLNLAGSRVVETGNQADDGRLSAASRANHADQFTRLNGKADAIQHGRLGIIGELYLVESNRATNRLFRLPGIGAFRYYVVGIQNGAHPIYSHCGLRD